MNNSPVLNKLKKILNQSKFFKNLSFVGNNYALLRLANKIFNISFNETISKDYYTKISVKIINLNYSITDTIEFYLSNYSENKTGISFSSNYGWVLSSH